MVRRHELTDAQWRKIEPFLPGNGRPGGQWADHRKVVNGMLFRARTGVPWKHDSWANASRRASRCRGLVLTAVVLNVCVPWVGAHVQAKAALAYGSYRAE
ncbi:transposase [Streptomyces sp. NPDC005374]|uniref:transposase n=1 Tax=Streptomyces sp. NPDC005374 TaxID=3364713 RepID=UPI003685EE87